MYPFSALSSCFLSHCVTIRLFSPVFSLQVFVVSLSVTDITHTPPFYSIIHKGKNTNRSSPLNDTFPPDQCGSGRPMSVMCPVCMCTPQSRLSAHMWCPVLIHFIPPALLQLREISQHTAGRRSCWVWSRSTLSPFSCPVIYVQLLVMKFSHILSYFVIKKNFYYTFLSLICVIFEQLLQIKCSSFFFFHH